MTEYWCYTRRLSSCRCVGCARSPRPHSYLCFQGVTFWPPARNSKSIEYRITRQQNTSAGFFRFLRVLKDISCCG
ncbi:hypothetical protein FMJ27_13180 [Klebsiella michiganensis]|nr:hypothetical protein [Klebsiella michiganensis]